MIETLLAKLILAVIAWGVIHFTTRGLYIHIRHDDVFGWQCWIDREDA